MALHPAKREALVAWVNSLDLGERVEHFSDLQDCRLLLKLVYKLKGEEPSQAPVDLPQEQRQYIVLDFLHGVCQEQLVLPSEEPTSNREQLEIQLAKVVLLLCFIGLINSKLVPKLEFEVELQMASMFRHVQQGENGFSLSEGLHKLLTVSPLIHTSSSSSASSYSDEGSPFFTRSRSPRVSFLELNTVASSSFVSSPIQEIINTPQVQLKRLRKELAREGDVRDELERELCEHISTISEKEGQISQLQHRLQRLLRDQEELEKEHKCALLELQQKNEGLLKRVHEVLKQCQDLKTDNTQKDRRIDELMEENGTLAAQVRNAFAQLARAEEEVSKLTVAHELSQAEWGSRRDSLQKELSQAITDRECLSEQIQILQGKISVLEDELFRVSVQLQEKGEVLGPVMEREKLKQELADLSLKLSQLEETISHLQKEKMDVEMLLSEERSSFERETLRLQGLISDLQQAINNIRAEREAQEQTAREKQELLTMQIAALEADLNRLQQLEVQLTAEIAITAELRKQRVELEAKVASLEDTVSILRSKCQSMEVESEAQQERLNILRADLQKAQSSLVEYEEKLADHQRVVDENTNLRARISALDDTVALLQNEIDAEKKRGNEVLAAKEQHKALMEEKFQKQEEKAHEMFVELESLSQELRKMKQQKLHAESCIEKLTEEGRVLAASLTEERDQAQLQLVVVRKAKDEAELELQCIIAEHESKIAQLNTRLKNVQDGHQKELEALQTEKEQIFSANQLGGELELKLREQKESILTLKEAGQQKERQNQELQEQLKLKTEAVEHYKEQVEKAKMHYNGKKQLLVEEQEARQALQVSLETTMSEVKALKAELKLSSIELEKTKVSEKNLLVKVQSLETQLDFADRQLREQRKQAGQGTQVTHRQSVYLKVPAEVQNTSTDSLELDLEDSLNVGGKPAVPGESSTPLVRSSERLASKRRAQERGSLETLYFTPMNPRNKNHDPANHQNKLESSITSLGDLTLDSAKKLTSSVRRRRTTQVINITMTKKTPGGTGGEAEDSFYSLHTTQSQPNLASQRTRPVSMEIFEEPGAASSSDKLLSLPGYRRSNVHGNAPPRAPSTFCVGSEYEPEHVADDWMRIAELQSRNKACLPHLKSSYPLESRPSLGFSVLPITDEDVRFGDPEETIRRASMVPSQLTESLSSHRLSLAPPPSSRDHTASQPQRYSMLPGQISAGTAAHRSSQVSRASTKTHEVRSVRSPLAPKRPASHFQDQDTPEAKKLASCFPRPATPKNRNLRSTASNSQNRPPSPADRRQSMAFIIDNTPKKSGRVDSRLQRGINKLRNSTRKSPAATTRLGRAAPQDRLQRKSPRNLTAKSPKIPTSAKKLKKFMMFSDVAALRHQRAAGSRKQKAADRSRRAEVFICAL
ncbi:hypothetical protein MHYP_G00205010 [Metynnis hypsauchen]